MRILESGDPYAAQLRETADAVASNVGRGRWSIGWQSAGRTAEEWLGPDILEVMRQLAASGSPGVIVCPAGFVSDHLEILYDLDIECQRLAKELGLPWQRTESFNADPAFLAVLADVAIDPMDVAAT